MIERAADKQGVASSQATLVDSNVLIDVLADDPVWADWSLDRIERCGNEAALIINPLILAKLSPRFEKAGAKCAPANPRCPALPPLFSET